MRGAIRMLDGYHAVVRSRRVLSLTIVLLGLLAPGTAVASPSWHLMAVPTPDGAMSSVLNGVSCASARACIGVGRYTTASGASHAMAARWNGFKWTLQAVPRPGLGSGFGGVSCLSESYCIAVGGFYTDTRGYTLAERWNGSKWSVMTSANDGKGNDYLRGVSCASSRWCVAVGDSQGYFAPLAESWNGTSWKVASGIAAYTSLEGVSCTSNEFCVAVGDDINAPALVERWNGSTWQSSFVGIPYSYLNGVSCRSATWCMAVGYQDPFDDGSPVVWAAHWNGSSWEPQSPPEPDLAALVGVSCALITTCTAVGGPWTYRGGPFAVADGWNGSSWLSESPVDPPGSTTAQLNGVSCPSETVCVAVGGASTGAFAEEN